MTCDPLVRLPVRLARYAGQTGSRAETYRGRLRAIAGAHDGAEIVRRAFLRYVPKVARSHARPGEVATREAWRATLLSQEQREDRRARDDAAFRRRLVRRLRGALRRLDAAPFGPGLEFACDPVAERAALVARLEGLGAAGLPDCPWQTVRLGGCAVREQVLHALAEQVGAPVCARRGRWSATIGLEPSTAWQVPRKSKWLGGRRWSTIERADYGLRLRVLLWPGRRGSELLGVVHETPIRLASWPVDDAVAQVSALEEVLS